MENRVTLILEGDLELTCYFAAGVCFATLLKTICDELQVSVRWKIDRASQAPGTIAALGDGADSDVEAAVRKYSDMAAAVAEDREPPCGHAAFRAIAELLDIKDPEVTTIRFLSSVGSWSTSPHQMEVKADESMPETPALGLIRQAPEIDELRAYVEDRVSLRDKVSGSEVKFKLDPKGELWLRSHIGQPVALIGAVRRSPSTGAPLEISNVQQFLDENQPNEGDAWQNITSRNQ